MASIGRKGRRGGGSGDDDGRGGGGRSQHHGRAGGGRATGPSPWWERNPSRSERCSRALVRHLRYTRRDDAGRMRVYKFLRDMEGKYTMEDVQMVVLEGDLVEMIPQGENPLGAILTCIDKCAERPRLADENLPRPHHADYSPTSPGDAVPENTIFETHSPGTRAEADVEAVDSSDDWGSRRLQTKKTQRTKHRHRTPRTVGSRI